jgi:hypothetical protein
MGKHSGLGLLEHVLGLPRHGLKPEEGKRVLKKVRREAVRLKRSLTVEEVERLCGSLETAQSVP